MNPIRMGFTHLICKVNHFARFWLAFVPLNASDGH